MKRWGIALFLALVALSGIGVAWADPDGTSIHSVRARPSSRSPGVAVQSAAGRPRGGLLSRDREPSQRGAEDREITRS